LTDPAVNSDILLMEEFPEPGPQLIDRDVHRPRDMAGVELPSFPSDQNPDADCPIRKSGSALQSSDAGDSRAFCMHFRLPEIYLKQYIFHLIKYEDRNRSSRSLSPSAPRSGTPAGWELSIFGRVGARSIPSWHALGARASRARQNPFSGPAAAVRLGPWL